MIIKILIFILILTLLMISVLLFTVAGLMLCTPKLLVEAMSTGISVCCIIAGVILLVPSLIAAILSLVALTVHTKKKYDDKSGKDV